MKKRTKQLTRKELIDIIIRQDAIIKEYEKLEAILDEEEKLEKKQKAITEEMIAIGTRLAEEQVKRSENFKVGRDIANQSRQQERDENEEIIKTMIRDYFRTHDHKVKNDELFRHIQKTAMGNIYTSSTLESKIATLAAEIRNETPGQ